LTIADCGMRIGKGIGHRAWGIESQVGGRKSEVGL